jgi:hypothetical protein
VGSVERGVGLRGWGAGGESDGDRPDGHGVMGRGASIDLYSIRVLTVCVCMSSSPFARLCIGLFRVTSTMTKSEVRCGG